MIKTTFADTVTLHNTDKGQDVEAEVLEFKPNHFLSVSIQRQIKVKLQYVAGKNVYVGSMAGFEFTTPGPKEQTTYQGRGR
jgi:hypothetical protein